MGREEGYLSKVLGPAFAEDLVPEFKEESAKNGRGSYLIRGEADDGFDPHALPALSEEEASVALLRVARAVDATHEVGVGDAPQGLGDLVFSLALHDLEEVLLTEKYLVKNV